MINCMKEEEKNRASFFIKITSSEGRSLYWCAKFRLAVSSRLLDVVVPHVAS